MDRVGTSAQSSTSRATSHISGLDGLRAIAVSVVLLFHADFYWARGGYLGVDLFFVISGFLITRLIVRETDANGRFRLGQFYWRRAKRLLPAVFLLIAVMVPVALWLAPDALPRLRGDTPASLFYYMNWWLVYSHTSYFVAIGRPPLLEHLWSLAIEEQFYIFWALLVFVLLPRLRRQLMVVIAIALAVASATWMAVVARHMGYPGHGDPSRMYFGTDTHGFVLMFGSALGLLWEPAKTRAPTTAKRVVGWLVGVLTLAAALALFTHLGENNAHLYPAGFLLFTAVALGLIFVAANPHLGFGRCLDTPIMRWIGERSYGIYLWHWPIFMLTRPDIDVHDFSRGEIFVFRVVLTLLVSAASYRWLEMPVRRGVLKRVFRNTPTRAIGKRAAIVTVAALAMVSTASILAQAPSLSALASHRRAAMVADMSAALHESATPKLTLDVKLAIPTSVKAAPTYTGRDVTAIGDSVLLGASSVLKTALPGVDVHAKMGWQAADVINELKQLKKSHRLREVLLLNLGTNGYVYENQLRRMLRMGAGLKRIILVNSHVPRRWMKANNKLIARVAPDYANVVVVPWNRLSEDRPDYFIDDGVHLTATGMNVYIGAIMDLGHLVPHRKAAQKIAQRLDASVPSRRPNTSGDFSPTLQLLPQPVASDHYWHRMAHCETDSNWTSKGTHSGGLNITLADWKTWGGLTFAPTPGQATQAQQIIIANRISTQGWSKADGSVVKPVGFARWRCIAKLGRPRGHSRYTYTRASVLAQTFHLGERGLVVHDLERILGIHSDGIYGHRVQRRHIAYLKKKSLPLSRAGIPTHVTGAKSS